MKGIDDCPLPTLSQLISAKVSFVDKRKVLNNEFQTGMKDTLQHIIDDATKTMDCAQKHLLSIDASRLLDPLSWMR